MPPKSKTAPSTPRLSEYARQFRYPSRITKTVWPRVEAKGKELGLGFDWWQAQLGTVCLGYGEDGKYVATVGGIGLSIPRQVGKTYFVLAVLTIMCILFPGLQVVWTAHHLRTSTKTFTTLRGICRRKKVAPHVKAMRAANGEQQVEFVNGSLIMFGARSMGFGRGFDEIDVEVFDEAQILDTKALEDMIAATNQARHLHGALLFFMGTPPRPSDPSGAFTARRKDAWAGKLDDAIWLEIGADPKSDPDDESQWPLMNPSYPTRTPRESMQRLKRNLSDPDSWNREGRGVWDDEESAGRPIDPVRWGRLRDPKAKQPKRAVLSIDVSPNRKHSTIGVAGDGGKGRTLVMVTHSTGTSWVVPKVKKLVEKHDIAEVVLHPAGQAGALIPDLVEAGVEFTALTSTQLGQGCARMQELVKEGRLVHVGQAPLDAAVENARTRRTSAGEAELWDRRLPDIDISPVVAASEAVFAWDQHASVDYDPMDSIY